MLYSFPSFLGFCSRIWIVLASDNGKRGTDLADSRVPAHERQRGRELKLALYFLWIYPQVFADAARGVLFDLCMPGNRRALTARVFPHRMLTPFADLDAPVVG
jgi:hypothetical protein